MKFSMTFEIGEGVNFDDIKGLLDGVGAGEWQQGSDFWKATMRRSKMTCCIYPDPVKRLPLAENRPPDLNFIVAKRVVFARPISVRPENAHEIKDFAIALVRISSVPFALSQDYEKLVMYRHPGGDVVVCDPYWQP